MESRVKRRCYGGKGDCELVVVANRHPNRPHLLEDLLCCTGVALESRRKPLLVLAAGREFACPVFLCRVARICCSSCFFSSQRVFWPL